jgi:hypothetical protein
MNLTRHFTLEELTISQEAARAGLRNDPDEAQIEALRMLCVRVLQPLRDHLRRPVVISSGFRSATLNRRIGGVRGSAHTRGEAADIYVPDMRVAQLVDKIGSLHLPVDQCIDEFGRWVHVSHAVAGPQRRQFLKARLEQGKVVYSPIGD